MVVQDVLYSPLEWLIWDHAYSLYALRVLNLPPVSSNTRVLGFALACVLPLVLPLFEDELLKLLHLRWLRGPVWHQHQHQQRSPLAGSTSVTSGSTGSSSTSSSRSEDAGELEQACSEDKGAPVMGPGKPSFGQCFISMTRFKSAAIRQKFSWVPCSMAMLGFCYGKG